MKNKTNTRSAGKSRTSNTYLRVLFVFLTILSSSQIMASEPAPKQKDVWIQTEIRDSLPIGTSGFLYASRVPALMQPSANEVLSKPSINATCVETDIGWSCSPDKSTTVKEKESQIQLSSGDTGSYNVKGKIRIIPKNKPEVIRPFQATIKSGESAVIELATGTAASLILSINAFTD